MPRRTSPAAVGSPDHPRVSPVRAAKFEDYLSLAELRALRPSTYVTLTEAARLAGRTLRAFDEWRVGVRLIVHKTGFGTVVALNELRRHFPSASNIETNTGEL